MERVCVGDVITLWQYLPYTSTRRIVPTLHKKAYRGLRSEREQVQVWVGNYRRESCANGGDKKFPMTGLVARASSVVLCGGVWSGKVCSGR